MTTLVCLISNQHVPNLLPIHECKPDHLLLLLTSGMEKKGKEISLLNALAAGGLDYQGKYDILRIKDENSINGVYSALQDAYDGSQDKDWIINLTGGNKPMSMGAYTFSEKNSLKTLYIAENNQKIAVDLLTGSSVPLTHHLSTDEFLAGYGFAIQNVKHLNTHAANARKNMDIAAFLTLHHEDSELQKMLGIIQSRKERAIRTGRNQFMKQGLSFTPADNLILNNSEIRDKIQAEFSLGINGVKLTGTLSRYEVDFLTGSWLEVFVYGLLASYHHPDIWDLQHGLVIGGPGPGQSNEFDVSFMRDQSFCIVECKTGGQGHDPGANNTLYKIEAIKASLKALRVRTYLATTSPNVIDKGTGMVKAAIQNRCSLYDCPIIHGEMLREMADLYLKNDSALQQKVAAALNPQGG